MRFDPPRSPVGLALDLLPELLEHRFVEVVLAQVDARELGDASAVEFGEQGGLVRTTKGAVWISATATAAASDAAFGDAGAFAADELLRADGDVAYKADVVGVALRGGLLGGGSGAGHRELVRLPGGDLLRREHLAAGDGVGLVVAGRLKGRVVAEPRRVHDHDVRARGGFFDVRDVLGRRAVAVVLHFDAPVLARQVAGRAACEVLHQVARVALRADGDGGFGALVGGRGGR